MTMTHDQELSREVGRHLAGIASDVTVVPEPAWADVRRGLRRATRRRRVRRTATAGGAVMAVAALAGGVQAGVVPYPTFLPAIQLADSSPSALAEGPTRGSLAADTDWLTSLRERVTDARWDEPDGESWSVRDPDDVTVLFAGDIAGRRLAAIEAPYRWGAIEARQQVWYEGPAGATPQDMDEGANGDASAVTASSFTADDGGDAGVVMLAAQGHDVTLRGIPVLAADGSVERPTEPLTTTAEGVYVWTSEDPARSGPVTVESTGLSESQSFWLGDSSVPRVARTGRGDADPSGEWVGSAASELASWSGVDLGQARAELTWAGGEGDTTAWFTFRAPSGAVLLGLSRDPDGWSGGMPDRFQVLPARAPVVAAWQQSVEQSVGNDGYRQVPGTTLALLGPADAVSAELFNGSGARIGTVELVDGGGQVEISGATSVEFLAADGAELAQTDVVPWQPDALDDLLHRE